jgi:hypothetical protein
MVPSLLSHSPAGVAPRLAGAARKRTEVKLARVSTHALRSEQQSERCEGEMVLTGHLSNPPEPLRELLMQR